MRRPGSRSRSHAWSCCRPSRRQPRLRPRHHRTRAPVGRRVRTAPRRAARRTRVPGVRGRHPAGASAGAILIHLVGGDTIRGMRAVCVSLFLTASLAAQTTDRLTARNVTVAPITFKGRSAVQLVATPDAPNATSYAVVKDATFLNGTIEVDLAGQPAAGAGAGARGFIGIAFRMQADGKYEYIYLRPTNGRADDQVRRNHSTQYSSYPDFDFAKSRAEAPEKYESYVDLEPGVWTKFRIDVDGRKARLYVHGAAQPCLVVDDMKLEPREGGVALWVGPGTEGYFAGLKITPRR